MFLHNKFFWINLLKKDNNKLVGKVMAILLIFIVFIIFIQIFIIGLIFSKINVDVKKVDITYNKKLYVNDLEILIYIYVLNKVKIVKIKFYKDYLQILGLKLQYRFIKKIKFARNAYNNLNKKFFKILRNRRKLDMQTLNLEVNKCNLFLKLGTMSQVLTIFSIPLISTIITFFLRNSTNNDNIKKYSYKIIPEYSGRNIFNIKLDTNFEFETIKLIIFLKKLKNLIL